MAVFTRIQDALGLVVNSKTLPYFMRDLKNCLSHVGKKPHPSYRVEIHGNNFSSLVHLLYNSFKNHRSFITLCINVSVCMNVCQLHNHLNLKGSSDGPTTMSIFIFLPIFKSVCVLFVF